MSGSPLAVPELTLVPVEDGERVARVARLAEEIWLEHYPSLIGLEQTRYMIEQMQSREAIAIAVARGTRYFLLAHAGAEVGYAAFDRASDHLFLSKLYLLRDARGQGLGAAALDAIARLARADGLARIELTVNRNNALALRAYERFGMTVEGTRVTEVGSGYVMDDYVLGLRLAELP